TFAGSGNTTVSSIIGTTSGTVTKNGTGLLTLHGASTYTGNTAINAGTVSITNALSLGTVASNTTSVVSGATLNITNANSGESFSINGTGDTTLANSAYTGGALTGTGTAIQSGTVALATSSTIAATTAGSLFTVSGVISGGATANVTIAGPGVVQFTTATNTYSGTTNIATGGTLQLGTAGDRIPNASAVTVATGGVFDVNGQAETIGSLAGAGNVLLGSAVAGSGALTAGGNNTSTSYSGNMSGTGTFIKAGTGNTTLTGTNTITGLTTVSAGILQVGTGGSTNNSPATVTAGTGSISGAVTVNSTGTLAGTGTVGGLTTIASGGILSPGDTGGTGKGPITLTGGLTVANGGKLVLDITTPTNFDSGVLGSLTDGTYSSYVAANAATWNLDRPANGTNDYISVVGNLSLGTGAGTVTMNGNITGANIGSIFKLMDWTSIGAPAPGGFNYATDVNVTGLTTSGNSLDFQFFNTYGFVVVVPEPSRVLLVLFGLLSLALRRRRSSW
ncbi:MAG: Extracellular serine protease precursor, partial [Verrucomicrobiaceae bacterium]|nr:Extracellular serine protease precursor [Verrucomicrobiaceae bacterium]